MLVIEVVAFIVGTFVATLVVDSTLKGASGGGVILFFLLIFLNACYAGLFKYRGKMAWFLVATTMELSFGFWIASRFL